MTRTARSLHLLTVFATLLAAFAATTLFKAQHVPIWKMSIVATEFGHWLALVSLVFVVARVWGRLGGVLSWTQLAIFLFCFAAFSRPFVEAVANEKRWASDLQSALGVALPGPLVTFGRLWVQPKEPAVMPEKIIYTSADGANLSIDFYRSPAKLPSPWILIVHGGGWDSGDTSQLTPLNFHLVKQGYAVAAITYRLAPKFQWPAQRNDVKAAVAYVKAHAEDLNIDPRRWVILGRSAGGQIAEAAAFQIPDPSLKGLVAYYSPADLEFAYRYADEKDIINSKALLINYLGGPPEQVPDAYKDASPIRFVSASAPPALLIHGRQDPLTWNVQSSRLHDRIAAVGGRSAAIEFPWGTHAFDYNLNGPGGQVATNAVDAFLATVLRGPNAAEGVRP